MTVVLIGESSGESKLDTIVPVPAPVKNSTIYFSFFIFPNTLSLSNVFTIFESSSYYRFCDGTDRLTSSQESVPLVA